MFERQELMRPCTSRVAARPTKMPLKTTGWLDSDGDDDDNYNDDKQPLLNENVLKQQQQYLLKGKDQKLCRITMYTHYFLKSVRFFLIEQDDGLNELASIVSRQKNIAITINSEVDLQNG